MDERIIRTLNYYDGIAQGYRDLYHEEQKLKISKVTSYLPNSGLVLDLGCGDGVLNNFLSSEVRLISFDLSFELLKINDNYFKINGSILNLPFKDNSQNFILSFSVFQDLPDILRAVLEVYRVMKSDSIFIVSFLHMSSKASMLLELFEDKFEVIEKIKEEKDWILVLKKSK